MPSQPPLYAIGDIHGRFELLMHALEQIKSHGGDDASVVFIGDYVDRGPSSCQVLEYLITQQQLHPNWVFLKGNHERMFEYYMRLPSMADPRLRRDLTWLHPRLGGMDTLASYRVSTDEHMSSQERHRAAQKRVPAHHLLFIQQLRLSFEAGPYYFAHAGIHPERALHDQIEEDLIWIREPFHIHKAPYEKIIIHGHTPVEVPTDYGNRINIDTGAAYGGPLTVLYLPQQGAPEVISDNGPLQKERLD